MCEAYTEEEVPKGDKTEKRTVLKFAKELAPIKAAVLPLKRNEPRIVSTAKKLVGDLQKTMAVQYDDTGSIGKLYRRQDEVGTLWCVTVDFDTIEGDGCVTVRDRDTMEQTKVSLDKVKGYLRDRLDE